MPAGGSVLSLTASPEGFLAVVRGDTDAELWRSSDGVAWVEDPLPSSIVLDVALRGAGRSGDTSFVYGMHPVDLVPSVWARRDGESWRTLTTELSGAGTLGSVWSMTACPEAVTFTGHDSASNQVRDYRMWAWDGVDELVVGWAGNSGPPGSGAAPPFVTCGTGELLALVTVGVAPPGSPPVNEVWSSQDGFDWVRRVEDALTPPMSPGDVVETELGTVALAAPAVVAVSPDGLSWRTVSPTGFDADDWIITAGGGGAGVMAFGLDQLGEPPEPVVWWSADGEVWQRIPQPEFWDATSESLVAASADLVIVATGDGALWRGIVEP
jgi:hypothetical protein